MTCSDLFKIYFSQVVIGTVYLWSVIGALHEGIGQGFIYEIK
jgi:hypothetical protein